MNRTVIQLLSLTGLVLALHPAARAVEPDALRCPTGSHLERVAGNRLACVADASPGRAHFEPKPKPVNPGAATDPNRPGTPGRR